MRSLASSCESWPAGPAWGRMFLPDSARIFRRRSHPCATYSTRTRSKPTGGLAKTRASRSPRPRDHYHRRRMNWRLREDCRRFYAEAGFPEGWRDHHQGGMAGYASREIIATPTTHEEIEQGQAFAWNPSLVGAKAEETFVLSPDGPEVLTRS